VTTAGGGLVHEMILAAGLTNHARHAGGGWIAMPLERLVGETPDLILTGFFTTAAERVNRWSAGRHPVMQARLARTPTLDLDAARLSCGGWHLAHEAVAIRRAADAILNGDAP
jgi:iron complex transport system substrate-binding protein